MLDLSSYNLSTIESSVFKIFEEISAVPRGSGNMQKIADYCVSFAENLKLEYIRDEFNNVVIFKPAAMGYENAEPIILQGHLDIVCQKDDDRQIDFLNDSLEIYRDGDFIKAKGTTLGGDNGIAVAFILAILSSDIPHPAIEAVLTTDEEIGLIGAGGLDKSILKSRKMINIDSEEDNVLTVSCAGGEDVILNIPLEFKDRNGTLLNISIGGLLGGHSGVEIDKNRTNANTLLGKLLNHLNETCEFELLRIAGGTKENAIPNSATATVCCQNSENLLIQIDNFKTLYFDIIKKTEPDAFIEVKKVGKSDSYNCLDEKSKNNIIHLLTKTPNGVVKMSDEIEGLVETSLNLGVLATENNHVKAVFALRSNKESSLKELTERIVSIGKKLNAKTETEGFYPPWEYNPVSPLRELYKKCYLKQNGKEIKVEAIHAGLECAVFSAEIKGLDCISVGPNLFDVHTTNERLSISSTVATFNLLLNVLTNSKQ